MVAHTLHFKPTLTPPLQKIVRKTPISSGVLASKTWTFYSACTNFRVQHLLGVEICSSKQVNFGGTIPSVNLRG